MTIDSACSASLVALDAGSRSLCPGDGGKLFVGGVSLHLTPGCLVGLSRAKMLSPSGRSKTFDDSADGFGRGEGCVVAAWQVLPIINVSSSLVVVMLGSSAVNQDGRSASLTAPNGPSQKYLV